MSRRRAAWPQEGGDAEANDADLVAPDHEGLLALEQVVGQGAVGEAEPVPLGHHVHDPAGQG